MATKKGAKGVGVGAAVAAAAVAAGAYYLYGSKNAAKHRKQVKGWMNKASKEVASQVKKAKKELSKVEYDKVVDQAMKKYHKMSSVSTTEVNQLARTLKKEWKKFVKSPAVKKAKKTVKKTKQVAKKRTVKKRKVAPKKRSSRKRRSR